ncbi:protein rolling stone-like [Glandiceps talaboti]
MSRCCRPGSCSGLGFEYHDAARFAFSEWQCIPPVIFLVYRTVFGLYMLGWFLYYIPVMLGVHKELFLLYMSIIANILLVTYFITAAITSWRYFLTLERRVSRRLSGDIEVSTAQKTRKLPRYFKLLWLLYTLACMTTFVAAVVNWALLYRASRFPSFVNFQLHGVNALFILIEIMLNAIPVRFGHCIYSYLLAVVYTVALVIFWAAGGQNNRDGGNYVYHILDFGKSPVMASVSVVGCFFLNLVLYTLLWGTYKLKRYLSHRDFEPCSCCSRGHQTTTDVQLNDSTTTAQSSMTGLNNDGSSVN